MITPNYGVFVMINTTKFSQNNQNLQLSL